MKGWRGGGFKAGRPNTPFDEYFLGGFGLGGEMDPAISFLSFNQVFIFSSFLNFIILSSHF